MRQARASVSSRDPSPGGGPRVARTFEGEPSEIGDRDRRSRPRISAGCAFEAPLRGEGEPLGVQGDVELERAPVAGVELEAHGLRVLVEDAPQVLSMRASTAACESNCRASRVTRASEASTNRPTCSATTATSVTSPKWVGETVLSPRDTTFARLASAPFASKSVGLVDAKANVPRRCRCGYTRPNGVARVDRAGRGVVEHHVVLRVAQRMVRDDRRVSELERRAVVERAHAALGMGEIVPYTRRKCSSPYTAVAARDELVGRDEVARGPRVGEQRRVGERGDRGARAAGVIEVSVGHGDVADVLLAETAGLDRAHEVGEGRGSCTSRRWRTRSPRHEGRRRHSRVDRARSRWCTAPWIMRER